MGLDNRRRLRRLCCGVSDLGGVEVSNTWLSEDASHPSRPASPRVFIPPRIVVEKGFPLPPKRRAPRSGHYGAYLVYPWRDMEVGDSFAVPIEGDSVRAQAKMTGATSDRSRRYPELRYATRVLIEDGRDVIRVWRTA